MDKNVGALDRFFRLGVGFLSLSLAVALGEVFLKLIFGAVAILGLATAATGYCPINQRFGINSRKK